MNVTIKDGQLCVDAADLIASLSSADRAQIIQHLACNDQIITEVMNQVLEGFTSEGWHGPISCTPNPEATYGISGARMRIAKGASDVAAAEIAALAAELARSKAREQAGWDAYHDANRRGLHDPAASTQGGAVAMPANGRVSMLATAGVPKCETCRHLSKVASRPGGWCSHPANRTAPCPGWPTGFQPSQAWDGSCELHPERAARQEGSTT